MKYLGLLVALFGLQSCLYMTAAHSTAGRAYVIRNELVGSSYWNCYANGGDPVCYQVTKVDKDTKIAALDSQPNGAHAAPKAAEVAKPAEPGPPAEPAKSEPAPTTKKASKDKPKAQASNASTRKPLVSGEN
jgi:hypothetical protein